MDSPLLHDPVNHRPLVIIPVAHRNIHRVIGEQVGQLHHAGPVWLLLHDVGKLKGGNPLDFHIDGMQEFCTFEARVEGFKNLFNRFMPQQKPAAFLIVADILIGKCGNGQQRCKHLCIRHCKGSLFFFLAGYGKHPDGLPDTLERHADKRLGTVRLTVGTAQPGFLFNVPNNQRRPINNRVLCYACFKIDFIANLHPVPMADACLHHE